MLVLSRKIGEEIVIGEVRVRVLRLNRRGVSIGVEAPRDVRVNRAEVHERQRCERSEEAA